MGAVRSIAAEAATKLLKSLEPWYNWGRTYISRMDSNEEGPGFYFDLQWLGLNVSVFIGRTPKREG